METQLQILLLDGHFSIMQEMKYLRRVTGKTRKGQLKTENIGSEVGKRKTIIE